MTPKAVKKVPPTPKKDARQLTVVDRVVRVASLKRVITGTPKTRKRGKSCEWARDSLGVSAWKQGVIPQDSKKMPLVSGMIPGDSRSTLGIEMQGGDKTNVFANRVVGGTNPVMR